MVLQKKWLRCQKVTGTVLESVRECQRGTVIVSPCCRRVPGPHTGTGVTKVFNGVTMVLQ
jgi:hypothetical protein